MGHENRVAVLDDYEVANTQCRDQALSITGDDAVARIDTKVIREHGVMVRVLRISAFEGEPIG